MVLVTINGAVPVAMFELKIVALACALTYKLANVPKDVMFGCAAVVTVPAVVELPAVATFKLATCVVDVTINGAVPLAIVLVIVLGDDSLAITVLPVPLGVRFKLPLVSIVDSVLVAACMLPNLAVPLTSNNTVGTA